MIIGSPIIGTPFCPVISAILLIPRQLERRRRAPVSTPPPGAKFLFLRRMKR